MKAVVSATTGTDHIDLEAAQERGVAVLCLRGEYDFLKTISATAEHTWSLLLALIRRVPWAFDDVRRGGWNRDHFRGHDLIGMRLGILGLGRIGSQVARFGIAFGMEVGAFDPFKQSWQESVQRFATPEELLRSTEVLCVHLPLNEQTSGFLDEGRLRLMPAGSWLINTSRGAILDENALVKVLHDGHLAGAAVDVLSNEQVTGTRTDNPLLEYAKRRDNLLITPHLAGATREAMERTEIFMAQKLRRALSETREAAACNP